MSDLFGGSWQTHPGRPVATDSAVHLWRFPLDIVLDDALLSDDERARAARLRVPGKARAFVAGRTALRRILGRYLGTDPRQLTFSYNRFGKPFLDNGELSFNLSHSGGFGLFAVTLERSVGVDIERIDTALDFAALARRYFSASEQRFIEQTVEARQRRRFYRLWTRKEAWLKGRGGGFSESQHTLAPGHLFSGAALAEGWWVGNVPLARGYVGALAVEGELESVERWIFDLQSAVQL